MPRGTVSSFGETPLDVSVKVYGLEGLVGGVGVELPLPQDARNKMRIRTTTITRPDYRLLNNDAALQAGALRIAVIVIPTRAAVREAERGL